MSAQDSLFHCVRRWRAAWVSDRACAQCLKPERPWRRMMWFPFSGSSAGAFICSDRCWDRFEAREPDLVCPSCLGDTDADEDCRNPECEACV